MTLRHDLRRGRGRGDVASGKNMCIISSRPEQDAVAEGKSCTQDAERNTNIAIGVWRWGRRGRGGLEKAEGDVEGRLYGAVIQS